MGQRRSCNENLKILILDDSSNQLLEEKLIV